MNRPPRRKSGVKYAMARKLGLKSAPSAAKSIVATGLSFAKRLVQSSLAVLVVLLLTVLGYGLLLRAFAPRPLIAVDPFEVPAELDKEIGVNGKNAANIFIDQVNETAKAAQAFRGSEFSSKHHYGHVSDLFRVPVQGSYGLQISGISVDDLVGLYRRVRYEQWKISGDVFKEGPNVAVRVRMRRGQDAQDWEIPSAQGGNAEGAIRTIAQEMLTANQPEAMGRAYLEWGLQATDPARRTALYTQAVGNFRSWAMRDPENPLPFYYMALAYHFQGDQQDSVDLAKWSEETAGYAKEWGRPGSASVKDRLHALFLRPDAADKTVDADRWLIANAKLKDSMVQNEMFPATDSSTPPDDASQAISAQKIEDIYSGLVRKYPTDLEYRNDFGAALINTAKSGEWQSRYAHYLRAVQTQAEVVKREPDNAGFQTNLASTLLSLANAYSEMIADKNQAHPGHNKEEAQKDMVQRLREAGESSMRAVHLLPSSDRALRYLTDAILQQEDSGVSSPMAERLAQRAEVIHLCRTAILLSSDPSAVKMVYARFLLNLYIVNEYAKQPQRSVLPDMEKNKATRLLDEEAVQQAAQELNGEIATQLSLDKTGSKENQANVLAHSREFVEKSVSQFNHELELDDQTVAQH